MGPGKAPLEEAADRAKDAAWRGDVEEMNKAMDDFDREMAKTALEDERKREEAEQKSQGA